MAAIAGAAASDLNSAPPPLEPQSVSMWWIVLRVMFTNELVTYRPRLLPAALVLVTSKPSKVMKLPPSTTTARLPVTEF
jgi:hypothetical protein